MAGKNNWPGNRLAFEGARCCRFAYQRSLILAGEHLHGAGFALLIRIEEFAEDPDHFLMAVRWTGGELPYHQANDHDGSTRHQRSPRHSAVEG